MQGTLTFPKKKKKSHSTAEDAITPSQPDNTHDREETDSVPFTPYSTQSSSKDYQSCSKINRRHNPTAPES